MPYGTGNRPRSAVFGLVELAGVGGTGWYLERMGNGRVTKRSREVIGSIVAGFVVVMGLLLVATTAGAVEPLKLAVPPLSGKAKVGTRSFELVDHARPAGFDQPGPRRLMVQVTYPRRKRGAGPCRKAEYLPARAQAELMKVFAVKDPVVANTRSCAGGPVMKRRSPLILFSHAYTADRAVYTSLVNDLASRGFIVASVDHTWDAFTVEFPSGEMAKGLFGSPISSKPVPEEELVGLVNMRTRDIRFVTTWLMKRNRARKSWLRHRIDRKRIGVAGHSLGGATAARVALVDRRFRAYADIDGSLFGEWPLTGKSDKPFLLFVAEDGLGSVLPKDKACRWFGNAARPKLAWELTGGMHLTFSDIQALAPQIAAQNPAWAFATLYPMITGNLHPAASIRSQRNSLARFFRSYLPPAGKKIPRKPPEPPVGVVPLPADDLVCAG